MQDASQKTSNLKHYINNNNNGEKSDSDDCSSSYSDFYCKSSISAPAASNSMRILSGTGSSLVTMANRLRNAIPVPIDGPLVGTNISQTQKNIQNAHGNFLFFK